MLSRAKLNGEPGFDEVRAGLDAVMSAREGDSAVAARCRDRGMLLYKQDRYVEALTEFHDAKRRWLNGDSIEGAILAMQMIARCYGLLGLHLAAKQYWMAAASLSDMDGAQARYVARAFEQVAIGAYQMGMWLDSAAFTHAALLANRALVANANGGGPEALPSLDAHAIYTTLAANRYWPQVTDTLKAAFGGTAWATDLPEVAQSAGEEVDWSEAEFSSSSLISSTRSRSLTWAPSAPISSGSSAEHGGSSAATPRRTCWPLSASAPPSRLCSATSQAHSHTSCAATRQSPSVRNHPTTHTGP